MQSSYELCCCGSSLLLAFLLWSYCAFFACKLVPLSCDCLCTL
jgi:hypothetical protein